MASSKKHTKLEMKAVLAQVAELDRKGYSQSEIGQHLGVSQQVVSYYRRVIIKRYERETLISVQGMRAEKAAQIRTVMKEAWAAWERSKGDKNRTIDEEVTSSFGVKTKLGNMLESRYGDPTFLALVIKCLKEERDLYGMDAPKKMQLEASVLDWDTLLTANRIPRGPVPDTVEAEIARVVGLPLNADGEIADREDEVQEPKRVEQIHRSPLGGNGIASASGSNGHSVGRTPEELADEVEDD